MKRPNYIEQGLQTPVLEAQNDIIENCDWANLTEFLC